MQKITGSNCPVKMSVNACGGRGHEHPTGTLQSCPKYEAMCTSQPWIPGLGMVRLEGWAQTLSVRDGERPPFQKLSQAGPPPHRAVSDTREQSSDHKQSPTHSMLAGIL